MDRMALEAVLKPVKHRWPLGGFCGGGRSGVSPGTVLKPPCRTPLAQFGGGCLLDQGRSWACFRFLMISQAPSALTIFPPPSRFRRGAMAVRMRPCLPS